MIIDILFANVFRRIKLASRKLVLVKTATYRIGSKELPVLGCIEFSTMFEGTRPEGQKPYITLMIKRLFVNVPLAYNAIVGRET